MNKHKEDIWVDADNWMFEIEQSKNISPKMKGQHRILAEIKRRIDEYESKLSKASFKSDGGRYIYNPPIFKTNRLKQLLKQK